MQVLQCLSQADDIPLGLISIHIFTFLYHFYRIFLQEEFFDHDKAHLFVDFVKESILDPCEIRMLHL